MGSSIGAREGEGEGEGVAVLRCLQLSVMSSYEQQFYAISGIRRSRWNYFICVFFPEIIYISVFKNKFIRVIHSPLGTEFEE